VPRDALTIAARYRRLVRVPMIAVVLAACGEAPPPKPVAPRILEVPEVTVPPEPARSCETKYTPKNAKAAPAEFATAGTAILATRGNVEKLRPHVFAHGAQAISAALETGVTDHVASLKAALDKVPASCTPAWWLELRIAIQPAFTDTPPERKALIEAGSEELNATTQIVGTCGGCPVIALALASPSPPLVSAWLVVP
jgi:hypothetical protein